MAGQHSKTHRTRFLTPCSCKKKTTFHQFFTGQEQFLFPLHTSQLLKAELFWYKISNTSELHQKLKVLPTQTILDPVTLVMREYGVYVTQTAQGLFPAVQVIKQEAKATVCSWRDSEWTLGTASPLMQHPNPVGRAARGRSPCLG